MKIRLRLSVRMLLSILVVAGAVFYVTLEIIGHNFKSNASVETRQLNDILIKKYAASFKLLFDDGLNQIRYYSQWTENYRSNQPMLNQTLRGLTDPNTSYMAIWESRHLAVTDSLWEKSHGRVLTAFYRNEQGQWENKVDTLNRYGEGNDWYSSLTEKEQETVSEIYNHDWPAYTSQPNVFSLLTPIKWKSQFAGYVGIDFNLSFIQQKIDSLAHGNSFDLVLLSDKGFMLAHSDQKLSGKLISETDTLLTRQYQILDRIQSGTNTSFIITDTRGNDSTYCTLVSFALGQTNTNWALMIEAPLGSINKKVDATIVTVHKIELVGLIIMALIILIFSLSITIPLKKARRVLKHLALGNMHGIARLKIKRDDEIGDIARSVNEVVDGLERVTEFAENIGKGNYEYEFIPLGKNDILGNAVIDMRDSLKKAKIEETNREEEEKHLEWTSQGINLFNRVLRVDNQNIKSITYEVIKAITLYMEAHMGGIYLNTTDDNSFELVSYIGFTKEKYNKKIIKPGDGVVGRCIQEKETIFINDIPDDFDKIGSGLGSSLPKAALVVPLISNRNLVGVLEIASVNDIFPYQIAFVERIAETIASTIAAVKTNARTAELLDKAKKQAEELEQQEEEMRQNMEEMQATQEEAAKRENELQALIKGYDKMLPIIVYDTKGKIIDINDNYLRILKGTKAQYVGKQHKADSFMSDSDQQNHNEFWTQLNGGFAQELIEYIRSGKEEYWFKEQFIPVRDKSGHITKILCVGFDITELKKTESKLQQIKEGIITPRTLDNDQKAPKTAVIDLNMQLNYIDLTYLKMVYKKDPTKIYNILKLYFDTLPGQLQEVVDLSKSRDFNKLKSKSNSLKTKMNYMGLKMIYENLREIEKLLAEQKNMADIPGLLRTISNYWSLAYIELKKLLHISV